MFSRIGSMGCGSATRPGPSRLTPIARRKGLSRWMLFAVTRARNRRVGAVPISACPGPLSVEARHRTFVGCSKGAPESALDEGMTMESARTRWSGRRADRTAVKGRSSPACGAVRADASLALLPPRLLPLSAEQQSEAAELLSELLLTAARRDEQPSSVPGDGSGEREPSRREVAACQPGRPAA